MKLHVHFLAPRVVEDTLQWWQQSLILSSRVAVDATGNSLVSSCFVYNYYSVFTLFTNEFSLKMIRYIKNWYN